MAETKVELQLPQPPREVTVDIDLLNSINHRLNSHHGNPARLEPCTIYRVRQSIRNENPKVYHPQLVAIGPYHQRDPTLLPMERLKSQFLRDLIARHESNTVNNYIRALNDPSFVAKANRCYSEHVVLPEEENAFVEMMVFDGCFIIEFFAKLVLNEDMGELEFVKGNLSIIDNDLLLLENQIPFVVLQVLYDSSVIPALLDNFGSLTMKELAFMYISRDTYENCNPIPMDIHHLLHLRHASLAPAAEWNIPSEFCTFRSVTHYAWQHFISPVFFWLLLVLLTCRRPPLYNRGMKWLGWMPNATEMDDFGIKFEIKAKSRMLDVTFRIRGGVMEMPRQRIDARTELQLRNLIAFEQCCPDVGSHFTAYVALMNKLIDEAKDVAVLERSGVLESKLDTHEEVAKLFNTLGRVANLNYENHYLVGLFEDVKGYWGTDRHICRATIHKWKVSLMQNYFSSPWSTCSLIAAFVLLLLTVCQTFFAVFSYFHPPPSA